MKPHFDQSGNTKETISELIKLLSSRDPAKRKQAHDRLIQIGKPAVTALIKLTTWPKTELRREAASILGDMEDPSAIPTLINLLVDDAFEVRWRAAESLIKMKRDALIPLFQELIQKDRFDSVWFLEGVHHILGKLDEKGYLGPASQKVLAAFKDPVKEIAVPKAAEKALEGFENIPS
jgi:HEAT repeat protein